MEKRKFYQWSNNSVTVVVPENVYEENEKRWALVEQAVENGHAKPILPVARPIFTFSDLPQLRSWVTGDHALMEELLSGHEVIRKYQYVPFSCGYQWMKDRELAKMEEDFRTDLREAMDAFGLGRTTES